VAWNRIWGNAGLTALGAVALSIDHSVGTRILQNHFYDFPAERETVALGLFTRECTVMQRASIVMDNGANNQVVAREVTRTAPP
jgi:hypothetical protein